MFGVITLGTQMFIFGIQLFAVMTFGIPVLGMMTFRIQMFGVKTLVAKKLESYNIDIAGLRDSIAVIRQQERKGRRHRVTRI